MRNYKSSAQRLAYLFKQGLEQWQQRAAEKQKKLRSQAVRIKLALERCSFDQAETWFQETFGRSALAKRRAAFQST